MPDEGDNKDRRNQDNPPPRMLFELTMAVKPQTAQRVTAHNGRNNQDDFPYMFFERSMAGSLRASC